MPSLVGPWPVMANEEIRAQVVCHLVHWSLFLNLLKPILAVSNQHWTIEVMELSCCVAVVWPWSWCRRSSEIPRVGRYVFPLLFHLNPSFTGLSYSLSRLSRRVLRTSDHSLSWQPFPPCSAHQDSPSLIISLVVGFTSTWTISLSWLTVGRITCVFICCPRRAGPLPRHIVVVFYCLSPHSPLRACSGSPCVLTVYDWFVFTLCIV